MMVTTGAGLFELLIVLLTGGGVFGGGGLLGMPPGDRDAALVRCAPADALIYAEWTSRGKGEPGAEGIDGLAADPEIRQFIDSVERAVRSAIERNTAGGSSEEQTLARSVPPLVLSLLNRPGCLYASLETEPAAEPLPGTPAQQGTWMQVLSALRAAVVFHGGDQADQIAEHLNELVGLLPPEQRADNLQRQQLPVPAPLGPLVLHREGEYFLLGWGEATIDAVLAGLKGGSEGLSASERFSRALAKVAIDRTASVGWIDLKGIQDKVATVLGPAGAAVKLVTGTIGIDAVDSLATTSGVIDGQIHTRTFVATGGKTDRLLALAAGRGITPDDLQHVPADADLVAAFSVDHPKVLAAAREIIATADAQSTERFNQFLKQVETELGISFEEEVFQAFGDVWVLNDSPGGGGLLLTAGVLSLEVKDVSKARRVYEQLMNVLERALPGEQAGNFRRRAVHLVEATFMEQAVHFVNIVGDDVPFAPAFCLTETHLLAAPHPQALKAHLRFVGSKEDRFGAKLEELLEIPDGDLLSLTFVDAKPLVRDLLAFAPYLAQFAFSRIQSEGGEIDVFSFPSARAILPYVGNSTSIVVRTEDGILFESQNGIPIPGGGVQLLRLVLPWFLLLA